MKHLNWHLGLGDAIICAGMAVELAKIHGEIEVPAKTENMRSVQSFFHHHPEIHVVQSGFTPSDSINIGHYSGKPHLEGESFDEWLYRTAEIPFEKRWDSCPIEKAAKEYRRNDMEAFKAAPIVFIHDDAEREFSIDWDRIPFPDEFIPVSPKPSPDRASILWLCEFLFQAKQIHVIDSCFLHLVESLQVQADLFLHRYARKPHMTALDEPKLRKNWTIYV